MNTLIICCDQHNPEITGCYGNPIVHTPNLDALASRGTIFDHAYTATPICVPARAALATGNYPFRGGYWDNAHPFGGDQMSWGRRLKEAGVDVTAIGKLHFKDDSEHTFPDQRIPMNVRGGMGDLMTACRGTGGSTTKLREQIQAADAGDSDYLHYDRTIAQTAAAFLKEKGASDGQKPWCLYVGFTTPHYPLKAPAELVDLYRPFSQFPIAPEWHNPTLLHPALQQYKEAVQMESSLISDQDLQKAIAVYYAMVSFLDSQAGVVLSALKDAGLEDNTRVIYLDDHGDSAGEHGLFFKSTMNEGSVRIPMIMAGPDIPAGKRVAQPVSIVDIYPTLMKFYHIAPTEAEKALPGVPLQDSLNGQADPNRCIFSEYHAAGFNHGVYMLRRGDYKLIRYIGYSTCQLFDLKHDPNENHDLGALEEYQPLAAELNHALEQICDPQKTDDDAMSAQKDLINAEGGLKKIVKRGLTPFTAVPSGMGMKTDGQNS